MNDNPQPTQPLAFYCDSCNLHFDSLPDATGYEQAPCPQCHQVCVTTAFIEEDRRRARSFGVASLVAAIVWWPGFLSDVFGRWRSKRNEARSIEVDEAAEAVTSDIPASASDNPYHPPQTLPRQRAEGESATIAWPESISNLRASRAPVLFMSAAFSLTSLLLFVQFGFGVRYLRSSAMSLYELTVFDYYNVLSRVVMAPVYAYVSLLLWRYAKSLEVVSPRTPESVESLCKTHARLWSFMAIGVGLFIATSMGNSIVYAILRSYWYFQY